MATPVKNMEKRQKAIDMRIDGATYQQIGDAMGVTRERVRQWLKGTEVEGVHLVERDIRVSEVLESSGNQLLKYIERPGGRVALLQCPACCHAWEVLVRGIHTTCPNRDCSRHRVVVNASAKRQRTDEEMIGSQYGQWTIAARGSGKDRWLARCSCGHEKEVSVGNLRRGASQSCRRCGLKRREERYARGELGPRPWDRPKPEVIGKGDFSTVTLPPADSAQSDGFRP